MSIRKQIAQELQQIGSLSGASAVSISLAVPSGSLAIEVAALDGIGCSIQSLQLLSNRLEAASPDDLRKIGERLSERLTYLLEPIRPLELDRDGFLLQMRSSPPEKDDDGSRYYEILARREGLSLSRFEKQRGQPRRPVSAHLTREVLGRLAEDFAAVMS